VPNAQPPNTDAALLRRNTRSYLNRIESERFYGIVALRYEAGAPITPEDWKRSLQESDTSPEVQG
jgi:hypothetical protein